MLTDKRLLPTPLEIIRKLDHRVHGQEDAKRVLACAVYSHFLAQSLANQKEHKLLKGPYHCLIVGPSGSGKSLLVKTIAEVLNISLFFVNASSLTSEGYIGDGIGDVLARLEKHLKPEKSNDRTIVFLDEFDKLSTRYSRSDSPRGGQVQQEMLTVLEGNKITRSKKSQFTEPYSIDTSKLLFIMAGAFVGIEESVANRSGKSQIGFFSSTGSSSRESLKKTQGILPEDIIDFGFIPEIVGRIPNIVTLEPLTPSDLLEIMTELPNSALDEIVYFFRLHGIELVFQEETLAAIAEEVVVAGMGARGLRQLLHQCVSNVDFRLTELWNEGIRKIIIHPETLHNEEPELLTESSYNYTPLNLKEFAKVVRPESESGSNTQPIEPSKDKKIEPFITDTTNTQGWSETQLITHLEKVKSLIDYQATSGGARKWWDAFQKENSHRLRLVIRTAEELALRSATITEFFLAYVYSNSDIIQANLDYLDYERLRNNPTPKQGGSTKRENFGATQAANYKESLRFDEASPYAQIFWQGVEDYLLPLSGDEGSFIVDEWIRQQLTIERIFNYAFRGLCSSLPQIAKWKSYMDKRIDEVERKYERKTKTEATSEDLEQIVDGHPASSMEKHRFLLFISVLQYRYLKILLHHLPSKGESIAALSADSLSFATLLFSRGSFEEELSYFESLLPKICFYKSAGSYRLLLECLAPVLRRTFIDHPALSSEELERMRRSVAYRVSHDDLFLDHLKYLPQPDQLLPEQLRNFIEYTAKASRSSQRIAAECRRLWGPGPWCGD